MSVTLTTFPKEFVQGKPGWELPAPPLRKVMDEIKSLLPGSAREAEVRQWLASTAWKLGTEAEALLRELRAERKRVLPAQGLEVKRRANAQSTQQLIEDTNADLAAKRRAARAEAAAREAAQEAYRRAHEFAIEQKFAWQQQEQVLRYDPMGLWGPPNYKMQGED
jgi:hypothetical protein